MRLLPVGVILLALQSVGMAQVSGFVEAVGFNNSYRPDSWTPMLINLTSQSNATGDYQIQIVQQDLDKDNVTFTRDITLNAGTQQKFWAYFIPQPTNGGLPAQSMDDLQKVLRVYLATRPDGGGHTKQLAQLPVRLTLNNLDVGDPMGFNNRGQRLVLWITDGSSRPAGLNSEQLSERVVGTKEELSQVGLKPRELPENALAYDAVDTILWLNADAQELDEAGARRKEAIEQFVQRGGQLVVCQPAEIHRLDGLADLLPVDLSEATMTNCKTLDPLPKLAKPYDSDPFDNQRWLNLANQHQFQFAHAKARPDAIVGEWIDWKGDGSDRTPFIARRAWGLGSVTWVAADFGDPQLSLNVPRWPIIWDHVFGWNNMTIVNPTDAEAAKFAVAGDPVGASDFLFKGTDQEGKGAGLIGIAILFFVLYWIVAGPGSYLFLANRKRKELSWFVFGAAAIAAAAITPILVRIVLHGGPELKHASIAQTASGEHTHVLSRIGLYIPHDGMQSISLADTATDAQSILSALIVHPRSVDSAEFPAAQDYTVPVHDPDQPVAIDVPFRTTLKKLQAQWVGDTTAGIVGSVRLCDPSNHDTLKSYIAGTLVNQTGHDLEDVYLGFHHPSGFGGKIANWVLFIPKWKAGDSLDIDHEFKSAPFLAAWLNGNIAPRWDKDSARAVIDDDWARHWYSYLDGVGNSDTGNAAEARANTPILTFFDLLPPPTNRADKSENSINLIRRGGRRLNLSGALLAGRLVIVGQIPSGPIPCPLEVNDQKIGGDGLTVYQAVLPIDASAFGAATATGPTTVPTTAPTSPNSADSRK